MAPDQNGSDNLSVDGPVEVFVRSLDDKCRMLVILKSQLYSGRWEGMLEDLQSRLEGKPYIFKLANRIKDDVERIGVLQAFERQYGVDLADYVKLEP